MLIEPGKKAPAFTLKDQNGESHRLSDHAGQPVVLYFYPKDDTPGCTKETCDFRDNLPPPYYDPERDPLSGPFYSYLLYGWFGQVGRPAEASRAANLGRA